jgi:putative multiple sugar transport system permease protein
MADVKSTSVGEAGGGSVGGFISNHLREYGMLLALVVIMAFFQLVTDGTLLRPVNLTNLFLQNSYIIIMALGMLLVIVAGTSTCRWARWWASSARWRRLCW